MTGRPHESRASPGRQEASCRSADLLGEWSAVLLAEMNADFGVSVLAILVAEGRAQAEWGARSGLIWPGREFR